MQQNYERNHFRSYYLCQFCGTFVFLTLLHMHEALMIKWLLTRDINLYT